MQTNTTFFDLTARLSLMAQGGIVTHNDFGTQTLVKDIFASGACENIDFITPIGHAQGIGYFENGSDIIGLDRGIIIATGPVSHAAGPNDATDKSGNLPGNDGDPDLERLSQGMYTTPLALPSTLSHSIPLLLSAMFLPLRNTVNL
ncbi:MAG: choice-of-anchor L domain-containing protein [Saprospiraceae bacterium]